MYVVVSFLQSNVDILFQSLGVMNVMSESCRSLASGSNHRLLVVLSVEETRQ